MPRASVLALSFLLLLLAACGDKGGENNLSTLVVGLEASPQTLDPRVAQDAYSLRIMPLVFESLFQIDRNSEPAPELVESYTRDGLVYTFRLKQGRRFADGSPLTARDVVYTFRSQADPSLRSRRELVVDKLESIEAIDELTVRMALKEPYAPFLTDLVMGVVSENADKNNSAVYRERPFGSGPYQVEAFRPGEEVALAVNPEFTGPPPEIARLVFRVLSDPVTRVMSLERGEVKLLQNSVPPEDLPLLAKNPRIKLVMEPGINSNYLGMNLEDPALADIRVRRAIAHAIDRKSLVECFLLGSVTPAKSILSPDHWAYNGEVEDYDYDPALARSLLDEAGYADPDGAGPLPRFRLTYRTSQSQERRWIAEAIAYQLGEVGIAVEVLSFEFGTFFADIVEGNFQLYSLSWVGIIDPDIYYIAFHSDRFPPLGKNRNRYVNPALDRLVEAGRRSMDRDERRTAYREAQAILARDLPSINLWYTNNVAAMDKRLEGFVIYPGGDYRSLARAKWRE